MHIRYKILKGVTKRRHAVSQKLEKLSSHDYTAPLPINSCIDIVVRKPPDYCVCTQTKTGDTQCQTPQLSKRNTNGKHQMVKDCSNVEELSPILAHTQLGV